MLATYRPPGLTTGSRLTPVLVSRGSTDPSWSTHATGSNCRSLCVVSIAMMRPSGAKTVSITWVSVSIGMTTPVSTSRMYGMKSPPSFWAANTIRSPDSSKSLCPASSNP